MRCVGAGACASTDPHRNRSKQSASEETCFMISPSIQDAAVWPNRCAQVYLVGLRGPWAKQGSDRCYSRDHRGRSADRQTLVCDKKTCGQPPLELWPAVLCGSAASRDAGESEST